MPSSVRLTSSDKLSVINIDKIIEALKAVIEKYEVLRVRIIQVLDKHDGVKLVQQVFPVSALAIADICCVHDLTDISGDLKEKSLEEQLHQFALLELPLDQQLFSFSLYKLQQWEVVLGLNIHHLIYDGASMPILLGDILHSLDGSLLPSVSVVSLCVPRQDNLEKKERVREQWRKMLHGVQGNLRFSIPDEYNSLECQHLYLALSNNAHKMLQSISRRLLVPPTTLLTSILCIAFGILVGQQDFLLGVLNMDRNEDEHHVIGYYAKTLPLRVDFSSSPLFSTLVQSVLRNSAMIVDGGIHLSDLLTVVPCLRHQHSEPSPLRVLLSVFSFNYTNWLPKLLAVDGVEVNITHSHAFQAHLQSDIFVEIHPRGSLGSTSTVHYAFRTSCLNKEIIEVIHDSLHQFITQVSSNGDVVVNANVLPSLKALYYWKTQLLPFAIPINLPVNVASVTSNKPSIHFSNATVDLADSFFESLLPTLPDPMFSYIDSLLVTSIAAVFSAYTDQQQISMAVMLESAVFLLTLQLEGNLCEIIAMVSKSLSQSEMVTSVESFSIVYHSLSSCQELVQLLVCLNHTIEIDQAIKEKVALCITIDKEVQPDKVSVKLMLSGKDHFFDSSQLQILGASLAKYISNASSNLDTNVMAIPYWSQEQEPNYIHYSNEQGEDFESLAIPNMKQCYITQLEWQCYYSTPHAVALLHNDVIMTYSHMFAQVEAICSILIAQGVSPGSHISVYMTRSIWLYLTILAIMKASCVYVPIALQNSVERILLILHESDTSLLITDTILLPNLREYSGCVLCLDSLQLANVSKPHLPINHSLDSLCCLLYTSGTTGVPKGVAISNRNILEAIKNILYCFTADELAITLTASNVSFDAHIVDFLAPLLTGSCLTIVENITYIREGVTYTFITPTAACCVDIPDSLLAVTTGGEAFSSTCYQRLKKVNKVLNNYGPTECVAFVTCNDKINLENLANVGQPMPCVSLYVLNQFGNLVPPGFPGILHIAGTQVALGYYGNKEKTDAVFLPCCVVDGGHDIMYYTGDIARYLPNGSVLFCGRADHQVKLRGQRFELHEVENVITSYELVLEACALVINYGKPSAKLVAFVTPKDIVTQELMEYVKMKLPSYMIPSQIVPLSQMPMNHVGKVDCQKLQSYVNKVQMRNTEEQGNKGSKLSLMLADIFAGVLELTEYPVNGDFFEFGGHSLLVVKLMALINQKLNCNINVSHILQYSSPLALANSLQATAPSLQPMLKENESSTNQPQVTSKIQKTISECLPASFSLQVSGGFNSSAVVNALQLLSPSTVSLSCQQTLCSSSAINITGSVTTDGNILIYNCQECAKNSSTQSKLSIQFTLDKLPNVLTPRDHYIQSFLPLKVLQCVINPESHKKPSFLDAVPLPSLSEKFQMALSMGNFDQASSLLQQETGILITPQCLAHYPQHSVQHILQTHLKTKMLLTYKPTEPVVVLNKQKHNELPIFFIHGGIIGWPLPYIKLTKALDCYSIAIQRTIHTPTDTFQNMASYYVRAIQSVQQHGPYTLFGVCYGACLAYEIAQQISLCEHVKLVFLINNSPVQECRPPLFDLFHQPLPHTAVDPILFIETMTALQFPRSVLTLSPDSNLIDTVVRTMLSWYPWLPFMPEELVQLYMMFYHLLRCQWFHVPTSSNIENCVLIKNKSHPFFTSEDYGLRSLVNKLDIHICQEGLGYLSDKKTLQYVMELIVQYL